MRWVAAYLAVGAGLAFLCDRKQRDDAAWSRVGSSLLCLALWPLWAPVALLPTQTTAPLGATSWKDRIASTLNEAREAALGTPLSSLIPNSLIERVLAAATSIEQRHRELSLLLARPDLTAQSEHKLGFRGQSVERLRQLWQRDELLLGQLSELAEALRMQLLVARFSGGDADGARDIATELGAQIESLDDWFALDRGATTGPSDACRDFAS